MAQNQELLSGGGQLKKADVPITVPWGGGIAPARSMVVHPLAGTPSTTPQGAKGPRVPERDMTLRAERPWWIQRSLSSGIPTSPSSMIHCSLMPLPPSRLLPCKPRKPLFFFFRN